MFAPRVPRTWHVTGPRSSHLRTPPRRAVLPSLTLKLLLPLQGEPGNTTVPTLPPPRCVQVCVSVPPSCFPPALSLALLYINTVMLTFY